MYRDYKSCHALDTALINLRIFTLYEGKKWKKRYLFPVNLHWEAAPIYIVFFLPYVVSVLNVIISGSTEFPRPPLTCCFHDHPYGPRFESNSQSQNVIYMLMINLDSASGQPTTPRPWEILFPGEDNTSMVPWFSLCHQNLCLVTRLPASLLYGLLSWLLASTRGRGQGTVICRPCY